MIYNHTGQYGFYLFSTKEPGNRSFWLYLFVSIFCKVAVPLFLWLINIVGILASCIMVYFERQAAGGFSEWNQLQFINNFVVINGITLFITIRYIFEKVSFPDFCNRIIVSIGKTTFGIYLIHLLVMHYLTENRFIPILIECSIDSMIAVLLYCFGIMVVSYIIITIFLKVPYIKN